MLNRNLRWREKNSEISQWIHENWSVDHQENH